MRVTCTAGCAAVREHAWDDAVTRISGDLALWRACFPRAIAANVRYRTDLTDADFRAHFTTLRTLSCAGCDQPNLTSAAFELMADLEILDMRGVPSGLNMLKLCQSALTELQEVYLGYPTIDDEDDEEEGRMQELRHVIRDLWERGVVICWEDCCTTCGIYLAGEHHFLGELRPCTFWECQGSYLLRSGGEPARQCVWHCRLN